jgi:hypothetical protein
MFVNVAGLSQQSNFEKNVILFLFGPQIHNERKEWMIPIGLNNLL